METNRQKKSPADISPVTPDWLNEAESERMVASMEVWYPRLREMDIRTPETVWVDLEPAIIDEGTIHEHYWAEFSIPELREAVQQVGGPPAFLRTDMASDIYDMEDSSKIRSLDEEELRLSGGGVIGFNAMRAEVPFYSFAVREWLDIQHYFTAWGGKRVGVEVRMFTSGDTVDGWCFDWPANERDLNPDCEDWQDKYEETRAVAEERVDEIIPEAQKVAQEFEAIGSGDWSVDFVLAESGAWYCTDMAPRRMSQVATEIVSL